MTRLAIRSFVATALLLGAAPLAANLFACPFCSAVSQTLSEEMAAMDVVVIGALRTQSPVPEPGVTADRVPSATFEVTQVIKGGAALGETRQVQTLYFGEAKPGDLFLIMGVDPPKIAWSTPLKVSSREVDYLSKLPTLPKKGVERLEFFARFLEDKDDLLTRDAYDEFARAPYKSLQQLKPKMDHSQIAAWAQDLDIPASRRRLYLVMLGICGNADDLPMLQQMLRSEDRKVKAGLDSMIACYLTLAGSDGMPLIEELFLKNKDAEYADTYAAIMALRFHGTETDVIPRPRILEGLRHMLNRPQLADLVIPDLARWEDWSQMQRLADLFKQADEKSSWVRVPVINYLRACPKPEARDTIRELEKVDPDAVKRANTFFPFGGGGSNPAGDDATSRVDMGDATWSTNKVIPSKITTASDGNTSGPKTATRGAARITETALAQPADGANEMNALGFLGVMFLTCGVVMFAQWRLLTGAGRSH